MNNRIKLIEEKDERKKKKKKKKRERERESMEVWLEKIDGHSWGVERRGWPMRGLPLSTSAILLFFFT